MRTTIDIEPDVLDAAKELARQKHVGVGKVVSQLLRQALTHPAPALQSGRVALSATGFDPFPARGVVVSNDMVNRLRDAEGI